MPLDIEIGSAAPKFTLKDAAEKKVKLSDHRGQWVVLYFYPKDNTPGCTIEALEFTAAAADYASVNAVVIGISPDSCRSHASFIEKKDLSVMLLSDTEHVALNSYGVWQEKSMYGKKYMGVQRTTFLIDPKGVVRFVWSKVKAKGHAAEVLEKLVEMRS